MMLPNEVMSLEADIQKLREGIARLTSSSGPSSGIGEPPRLPPPSRSFRYNNNNSNGTHSSNSSSSGSTFDGDETALMQRFVFKPFYVGGIVQTHFNIILCHFRRTSRHRIHPATNSSQRYGSTRRTGRSSSTIRQARLPGEFLILT